MKNKEVYCGGKEIEGKEPYHLIPEICIREIFRYSNYYWAGVYRDLAEEAFNGVFESLPFVLEVLKFGAVKYGSEENPAYNSWKKVNDAQNLYAAAYIRHSLVKDGKSIAPDSKLTHNAHALTNALFLLYFEIKESLKTISN